MECRLAGVLEWRFLADQRPTTERGYRLGLARDAKGITRPIPVVRLAVKSKAAFKEKRALMSASMLVTGDHVSREALLDGYEIDEQTLADLCDHRKPRIAVLRKRLFSAKGKF